MRRPGPSSRSLGPGTGAGGRAGGAGSWADSRPDVPGRLDLPSGAGEVLFGVLVLAGSVVTAGDTVLEGVLVLAGVLLPGGGTGPDVVVVVSG